jgi:di/tricarboxylate transporter
MSIDLTVVLLLLALAIVMFAVNRPRMDAVALLMLVALPFTGVVTVGEALQGFSDPNIVLIAALFVLGDGLVRTGVARGLGDWLTSTAGSNETRLVILLMLVVCGLGATMSSTAVTAIFIPVALRIAHSTGSSAEQLMMPLSFAALISGMTTLVATAPNLVVNSELISFLHRHGDETATGFHFFSFTPFGVPILILGIAYMLFARRWLPKSTGSEAASLSSRPRLEDWVKRYELADRELRVRVAEGSPLAGQTLDALGFRKTCGMHVLAIERRSRLLQPTAKTVLQHDDILFLDLFGTHFDAQALQEKYAVELLPLSGHYFTDRTQEIGMAELIVTADSELVGTTVTDARFRSKYGLTVIGLRRGATAQSRGLEDERLKVGDTLLVIGLWKALKNAPTRGQDFVILGLPAEFDDILPVADKALHAVVCLALVVVLMVSGVIPNVQAALLGCLLMGLLGCVNLESAYRAIDWKTIVLIVGMLPFSTALQRTGGVDLAADALRAITSGSGDYGVLAMLFAITALLGMFISNTATAVLMAPVALGVAEDLDASPFPFAMIVALAASTAFMTPVSSPVNTLVVTPGNYTFGDFVRVGVPFSLIVLIVSVILVPLLLPL